jgi:hypothetical protein
MLGLGLPWIVVHALPAGGRALAWDTGRLWACPRPDNSYIALPGVSVGGLRPPFSGRFVPKKGSQSWQSQ